MTQRPMRRSKRVTTRVDGHEGHDQENEEPAMKKVKRDESAQEEDGGFTFTRKRALRPRKSLQQSGEAAPPTIVHQELKELPKTRRRKLSQSSVGHRAAEEDATVSKAPKRKSKGRGRSEVSLQNGHPTPPSSDHVAKIALPLSDTPVIRKNREFRKTKAGSRRSSVGMRGHRASSLIDNGHSAIPHAEVSEKDFHKHIASDLPEPRRMRQLLTWCGTRALEQKQSYSSAEGHARAVARVIQEELLKDFNDRAELSDWFSREDSNPILIFKRPNPRNEQNLEKIRECEAQLEALRAEQETWKGILNQRPETLPQPIEQPPGKPIPQAFPHQLSQSQLQLLDPPELAYLTSLDPSLPEHSKSSSSLRTRTQSRLDAISASLEFDVDLFADGTHTIARYQDLAEKVTSKVLAKASRSWAQRDMRLKRRAGTEEVSTREILRKLSRIDHND